ncbi:MAG: hypothetical protein ABIK28_11985 [Planctomycetota bacterium]
MPKQILRKAVKSWPPTIGAGTPDSPVTQPNDVIKRATVVQQEGILILSLSLEGKRTAAEVILRDNVEAVRRVAPFLKGHTIETAGRMPLDAVQ